MGLEIIAQENARFIGISWRKLSHSQSQKKKQIQQIKFTQLYLCTIINDNLLNEIIEFLENIQD